MTLQGTLQGWEEEGERRGEEGDGGREEGEEGQDTEEEREMADGNS